MRDRGRSDARGGESYPTGSACSSRAKAQQRAAKRVRLGSAHEEAVDQRREGLAVLEVVVEFESDAEGAAVERLESHRLPPPDLRILYVEPLPDTRLVGGDLLEHAAAAPGERLPLDDRAGVRVVPLHRVYVLEAVDEGRPAQAVVPERLRVGDAPIGQVDRRMDPAHGVAPADCASAPRSRSTARAAASSRGTTSARSRSRSASPSCVSA